MKTAGLTLLLVAMLCTSSCGLLEDVRQLSPEQQWALSGELYITTTRAITALGDEGLISLDDLLKIKEWKDKARGALDDWKAAILEDEDPLVLLAMKAFDLAMDELIKQRMAGEAKR